MKIQVSQLVRAPRERVFAAYIDIESMPKWSASAGKVRVISREDKGIRFEIEARTSKGPLRAYGELALNPPGSVTIEDDSGRSVTKGTVTFEEAPGGTLLTSTVVVEIKGLRRFFVRPALGDVAKEVAEHNLAAFAGYVEGLEAQGDVV